MQPIRLLLLALGVSLLGLVPAAPTHAETPVVSLAVTGAGVALRPAFDPATSRYAVGTTDQTDGTVTVDATTEDPAGSVLVDGSPASGPVTLTGLTPGAEISVIIDDAAGHHAYGLIYLPASFPAITKVVDTGVVQDGLTLVTFAHFAAALDRNGVPALFREFDRAAADLKPAPHGHYTVMVQTAANGGTYGDWDLLELDAKLGTVASYRTVGLTNTDSHDSILEPDGTRYLVGYEPDGEGHTDPTIQQVGPNGDVVATWNGGQHLDRAALTTANTAAQPVPDDWAHINSIQLVDGGDDMLASFRHLSAVLLIAWKPHDGYAQGDVIWRFGGRQSSFSFDNDPYGGPCAQHAAQLLPDGHLLLWDNGSGALGANPSYCVDPADRTGDTVSRPFTRVTEYSLDTTTMTAHLVSSWSDGSRFAYFAGSAYRLGGGDTLVDWAGYSTGGAFGALTSEYDAAGDVVWELSAPTVWSYRAYRADAPDTTAPVVTIDLPGSGRYDVGDPVAPRISCTDAGGSTLQSCTPSSTSLPTGTVGTHTFTVTATDGAGTTTVVHRSYVVGSPQPAVAVRAAGRWAASRTLHLPR
ncbi:MAG TPA: aryl-sulfate sulfotransferase, partial [Nocardioides sp.]|nr:aryl-sulfate sulfotransferase [Nocardioides sp.]